MYAIVKILKAIIEAVMPKILFIICLYFNFLISVPYIPFVEANFESLEMLYLNRQFLLMNVLKGFLASFKEAG